MTGECLRKIIRQLHLKFYILKKRKYAQLIFQKIIRIAKKQIIPEGNKITEGNNIKTPP